jgi:hypothetical protein
MDAARPEYALCVVRTVGVVVVVAVLLAGGCGTDERKGALATLIQYEAQQGHHVRGGACGEASSPKEWSCTASRSDGTKVHAVVTLGNQGTSIVYDGTPNVAPARHGFTRSGLLQLVK